MNYRILPIRRGQLIAPFGVGSLSTGVDGISLIIAGLDVWYKDYNEDSVDLSDFKIDEKRLAKRLCVDHLRLPPDYRTPFGKVNQKLKNVRLTIPCFRFPLWHFCDTCGLMHEFSHKDESTKHKHNSIDRYGNFTSTPCYGKFRQVRFIAACAKGHLQDFPWREWIQEQVNVDKSGYLYLISKGSSNLGGMKLIWKDEHGKNIKEKSLAGILDENNLYKIGIKCKGNMPWIDKEKPGCKEKLRGCLRTATNLYFPNIKSAIYLPPEGIKESERQSPEIIKIEHIFEDYDVKTIIDVLRDLGEIDIYQKLIENKNFGEQLSVFEKKYVEFVINVYTEESIEDIDEDDYDPGEDIFRYQEYIRFNKKEAQPLKELKTNPVEVNKYKSKEIKENFSSIVLVEKLKETRAFNGFSRLELSPGIDYKIREEQLWKYNPTRKKENWLPAHQVYGEGIFFCFNYEKLVKWSELDVVKNRIKILEDNYNQALRYRNLPHKQITPIFVMIHTFAHLMINQLCFECGYTSASLRERLFVSEDKETLMTGLLIYTASGDTEGSMGGLVNSGRPGYLDNIIYRSLNNARWCSADPVCMDIGGKSGQGPDSLNLAACHNCTLIPETSCEEFNLFLDRGLIIGTIENPELGFFSQK